MDDGPEKGGQDRRAGDFEPGMLPSREEKSPEEYLLEQGGHARDGESEQEHRVRGLIGVDHEFGDFILGEVGRGPGMEKGRSVGDDEPEGKMPPGEAVKGEERRNSPTNGPNENAYEKKSEEASSKGREGQDIAIHRDFHGISFKALYRYILPGNGSDDGERLAREEREKDGGTEGNGEPETWWLWVAALRFQGCPR